MTTYEFCWTISPSRGRSWQRKENIDGFEVEISGDRILVRSKLTKESEGELSIRANEIVQALALSMESHEGLQLTRELSYTKCISDSGSTGVTVAARDNMEMSDQVTFTVQSYLKCGAMIVKSSEEMNLESIIGDYRRVRSSGPYRRMLEFMNAFRADREKGLAPLYDILEIVETEFGNRKKVGDALSLQFDDLRRLGKIANDATIRTARHPGQSPRTMRDITLEELAHCERTAEAIIRAYAKRIPLPGS